MRIRLALPLIAVAALTLAACSTAESQADASATPQSDESLAAVQEAGVLVVGTEGTYRPFSYHEDGSGDLVGYDVDVIRAVAAELGVDVTFEETQWDAIFAGLDAGRFDVIANQVSITPEREEAYVFSSPYTYSTGVVVTSLDSEVASFDDLAGLRAAQSLTSNWYTLAEAVGAQIEPIEGWAQAVSLVRQGRVDATINDRLTYLDYVQQTGADDLRIAAETDDVSRSAFAFADGSEELAEAVSDALAVLEGDGTLAEISERYFGADVSTAGTA